MIEQYTITTTPKYNFPQPTTDTPLPQRFIELSINSLRQVRTNNLQLNPQTLPPTPDLYQDCPTQLQLKRQPLPLTPRHQETTIAAVDTSTIKIGETKTGTIIAIRGATVQRKNRNYHYTRLGPFIFHVTEDNKNAVYNNLERDCFHMPLTGGRQATPPLMQMPTRLASILERWLQMRLARIASDAVILFDGCLISGTMDTPVHRMREILAIARRNNNAVLAFSKATSLRVNGFLITDLLPQGEAPYLLETVGLRFKAPMVPMGDVYVARLHKANMAFRLDIDSEIPVRNRMEAVEKLLGNDALQNSYPETLRLAHILCTFTANEVLAMQHFATRKYGIQIVNRPDMHRLLFGSFGREGYA
ncbi:MAG: DNA double-strand break repair nuclease NurA [Candidatus Bathyarchaeota archaeon]|nr:DNA double-strand break repair nuclease NurA [Candidatus Bathyarchaeota archaeon]